MDAARVCVRVANRRLARYDDGGAHRRDQRISERLHSDPAPRFRRGGVEQRRVGELASDKECRGPGCSREGRSVLSRVAVRGGSGRLPRYDEVATASGAFLHDAPARGQKRVGPSNSGSISRRSYCSPLSWRSKTGACATRPLIGAAGFIASPLSRGSSNCSAVRPAMFSRRSPRSRLPCSRHCRTAGHDSGLVLDAARAERLPRPADSHPSEVGAPRRGGCHGLLMIV